MTPGGSTPTQPNPPQEPAPPQAASPPNKRDLKSWWKGFKLPSKHQESSGIDTPSSPGHRPLPPSSYQPPPRIVVSQFREDDDDEAGSIPESLLAQHDNYVTTIAQRRVAIFAPAVSSSDATREPQGPCGRTRVSQWMRECFTGPRHDPDSPPLPSRTAPSQSPIRAVTKGRMTGSKPQGIFGVPLRQSIGYANVAISLIDESGSSYIYGYVPIVVAKCGVFLKEKATEVEGIFRLSGSEKRIKELKTIFDSPDRYGKGLVWEGYTVHDASNVFRRYLNDLPEPVVPLDLYEKFREPLRGATKQASGGEAEGPQFVEDFDEQAAIAKYQKLITELPPLNRQLLLYILDLLAVFAAKSDLNRMNSHNLAAIFQPGILSHPNHAMAPEEYKLNQCVLIFLIENQDHFLIGMQGTAADETTRREVEIGASGAGATNTPPTPAAVQETSGLGRSASNASAGAESVRRDGMIRRNRSTSSRHSRHEAGATTPGSPGLVTTPTTGLARSNTVPSKKSPALQSGRFQNEPSPLASRQMSFTTGPDEISSTSDRSTITPAAVGASSLSPGPMGGAGRSQERLLQPHAEPVSTPSKERNLQSLFQRSPTSDSSRPRNKLRKRNPGSMNPSAHSSSASLHHSTVVSPSVEVTNLLEPPDHPMPERIPTPLFQPPSPGDASSEPTPRASQIPSNTLHPENTLKAKKSPPTSLNSSFNEGSDIDHVDEAPSGSAVDLHDKEKKSRWRISRNAKKDDVAGVQGQAPIMSPRSAAIGANSNAEASTTSFASNGKPRKSMANDGSDLAPSSTEGQLSYESSMKEKDGKDETKGPIGWIRNKYREAKENHEQRRNKSPPAGDNRQQSLGSTGLLPTRSKSVDIKREEEKMAQNVMAAPLTPTNTHHPLQPALPSTPGAKPG